ncbi:MAG: flavodoxin-dependent (E)-4-hydroxy-3-methylbut-2-enyl-diphosphate synthase [Clostridiales bacterium]|jgi:(E)-4-hydroxy-3-methylbut-2-enyl-diphosphate synthase|nr:flavodoxin-dependent (E)-4-hydroxy-3-methylbut-2-enyl-diphosphate synthase [Clostridiales bacterium]
MKPRKKTRPVNAGGVLIGGDNLISIQSMTNTDTRDVDATVKQITSLAEAGCEIVRVAVPDMAAAGAVKEIKRRIKLPLVADIHFDYRLALAALENGADKLRLNPGNIGVSEHVRKVAEAAKSRGVPIRVGVNAGSLEKPMLAKYGGAVPEALAESALKRAETLENFNFTDIVIAVKASSAPVSIKAYEIIAERTDYPLHVGITEAGTVYAGSIKSAAGIGAILSRGIGDTIRVSLTGDPVEEVRCAREILRALGLRRLGVEFVSCPTCGRTEIDLVKAAAQIEEYCKNIKADIKVAVMGCAVNGPGEARDADIGLAGGKGSAVIFKKGQIFRTVQEDEMVSVFIEELRKVALNG